MPIAVCMLVASDYLTRLIALLGNDLNTMVTTVIATVLATVVLKVLGRKDGDGGGSVPPPSDKPYR